MGKSIFTLRLFNTLLPKKKSMCYNSSFNEPSEVEVSDLQIVSNQVIEKYSNSIVAGYGSCTRSGCYCRRFIPNTTIPGAIGSCDACGHSQSEHS